jgi:hypothetical protein
VSTPEPQASPQPDWIPPDADLTKPSAARMYDYYLGGAHNFAVDRELATKVLEHFPDGPLLAQANRAFLHRAVRFMVGQGIRQFIDVGSGIPTVGNVHDTAQREAPDTRVLYVDHDPVAVAHSELILGDDPRTRVLKADLRMPDDILASPQREQLIDLDQPVGLLMVAVLHFVPDEERPEDFIARFRDALAPGSYLAIAAATDEARAEAAGEVSELYTRTSDQGMVWRPRARLAEFFAGWSVVEPGLVWLPEWRPDWPDDVGPDPSFSSSIAGVGRKDG